MNDAASKPLHDGRACLGAAALALAVLGAAPAAAAADVAGYWATGTAGVIVEIQPCGGSVCGRMVTLRPGGLTTDQNNKDEAERSRALCNLVILGGFTRDADGTWKDGSIYDPASGNTYAAQLTLVSETRLDLRGYVGIPLFGRTETWTRTAAPAEPCG